MSKIFERNIDALLKVSPFFKEKVAFLNKIELKNNEIVCDGNNEIQFLLNEQYYKVNSSYKDEEIEIMTKNIREKKDYLIVLFTIANLPLLHKIIDTITKDSRILIYEPNPYLFKYVLMNLDISFLLKTEQVGILFNYNNVEKFEQELWGYASLEWGNLIKNLRVISSPNAWHYREKCHYVTSKLLSNINMQIKMLGNSMEDIFEGQENSYKNIDAIIENSDLEEIKDKFQGYPAIIVASGPSLDKNIDILHKAQDKALIISCDASMTACMKYNVKPDAVASIERIEKTYRFYYEGKTFDEQLVLIGPDLLWPKIFEEFPGKKIITNKVYEGSEKWWNDNFENCHHLAMGTSCAHVAFAYARYAGCNPIILMGQDLAYTGDKIHSNLTHTKFERANNIEGKELLVTEDVYGNPVMTDDIYNMFRKWFEVQIQRNSELKVIDATEGGAKIHGSEIKTLQEVIDEYCTKELPMHLYDCLSDKTKPEPKVYIKKYEQVIESAKEQIKRIELLKCKASQHYQTLEEIYYGEELEKMSEKQLIDVVLKMQKGDLIIHEISEEEYLYTYFQQMIRQTIIFVKGLGNELTPQNIKQNIRFQANLMGVIKNSSNVIIAEYDKMIEFIERKKEIKEKELCVK